MNTIDRDELFGHVRQFLKSKGIDLQDGTYSRTVQKSCQVLADTINLSQQAMERTKVELETRLDQVRQIIHEKTAPRQSGPEPQSKPVTAASTKESGATKVRRQARRTQATKPQRRSGRSDR